MGKIQQQVGKSFEDEILEYYYKRCYFTYKFPTANTGTVFDIIAMRGNHSINIEAKHTTSDKLYYKGSGLFKKKYELDNFCSRGNDLFIYIKSDKLNGYYWITWNIAKIIFEEKGYLDIEKDCKKFWLNKDEDNN